VAQRKYEHRHLITRTLNTTSGDVTYFNADIKGNRTEHMVLNGKFTAEQFLRAVKPDGIVLMVENVQVESKLYGITVEEFLKHATEITD
jgi:hypothetical protein